MDALCWIYIINATILIIHEIDSAYWQEWKLLNPKQQNGINGFLLLHFPMVLVILIGLILLYEHKPAGSIISLLLASGGIFAFFFHFYHLWRGKQEFNTFLSKTIIVSTFFISVLQIVLTILRMTN
jgi:hypothetical protein